MRMTCLVLIVSFAVGFAMVAVSVADDESVPSQANNVEAVSATPSQAGGEVDANAKRDMGIAQEIRDKREKKEEAIVEKERKKDSEEIQFENTLAEDRALGKEERKEREIQRERFEAEKDDRPQPFGGADNVTYVDPETGKTKEAENELKDVNLDVYTGALPPPIPRPVRGTIVNPK